MPFLGFACLGNLPVIGPPRSGPRCHLYIGKAASMRPVIWPCCPLPVSTRPEMGPSTSKHRPAAQNAGPPMTHRCQYPRTTCRVRFVDLQGDPFKATRDGCRVHHQPRAIRLDRHNRELEKIAHWNPSLFSPGMPGMISITSVVPAILHGHGAQRIGRHQRGQKKNSGSCIREAVIKVSLRDAGSRLGRMCASTYLAP